MTLRFFGVALATALLSAPAMGADSVKIGMITTLSGGGSALGVAVRDGFELAIDQEGGKLGGTAVEFLVEDDARKSGKALQVANRFVKRDRVDIMTGIIWSNLAIAVVPAVVQQGKFYLSPNVGPSMLAGERCHENYFNVAWQNDNLAEAAGGYANDAGYANSFLLAPNYPAGRDMLTGYKRFYKGAVADEVYTKLGANEYAPEIAQIRASGADSVYFFLPGGMGIAFLKQYAQAGIDIPLVGPAFSFDQGILQAVGEAAMGVKNTSQWNKDIDNPTNKAFVESFQAEFGRLPSLYASQGFDTANLLISAMGKASVSDADAFRDALRAADFKSTRGDFAFASNHHPIQDVYVRQVVKEGDMLTNKILGTAFTDHADAYAGDCKM